VERLKGCDNIVALAEELGVHRRILYKWRDQLEPTARNQFVNEHIPRQCADLSNQVAICTICSAPSNVLRHGEKGKTNDLQHSSPGGGLLGSIMRRRDAHNRCLYTSDQSGRSWRWE
jgi:hypothetical protein